MPSPTRIPRWIEAAAPFVAGSVLLVCGGLAALQGLQIGNLPGGPMAGATLVASLLVAGAGAAVVLSSCEVVRVRHDLERAVAQAQRASAERELAMLQARRMRAQAEGLALMREIHRTTGIPDQRDRLHRILTLVADVFEAREVSLFAAADAAGKSLYPAGCLRTCAEEEIFVCFESQAVERYLAESNATSALKAPRAKDATLVLEGCRLFAEGDLMAGETPLAHVVVQRTLSIHEGCERQNPSQLVEASVARCDFGAPACRHAAQALEEHRTRRERIPLGLASGGAGDESLLLTVPLIADQRPVGALRIRRAEEGFDGAAAEMLEEMLIESGKHIALALKKDQDDRNAITDQLTGLFIKRHFLATLEDLRAQAAAGVSANVGLGKPFALVLLDIDHFKQVNDTHGHLSGDLVLKHVAAVLKKGLRSGDKAFRYGGEEMAVLMPGATQEAAVQTAERLRSAVQAARFHGEQGQPIPVTISLGVAVHKHGLSGEQLIGRADRALYASKRGGRNRTTPWSPELPDPLEKPEAAGATLEAAPKKPGAKTERLGRARSQRRSAPAP